MNATFHTLGDVVRIAIAMVVLTGGLIATLIVNEISQGLSVEGGVVRTFGRCFVVGCREVIVTLIALTALWGIGGGFLSVLFIPLSVLGAASGMVGLLVFQLLTSGDKETKVKFDPHQATIQSEPEQIQNERNKRIQAIGITFFLYLVTIAALRNMGKIDPGTYRPLLVVSLFVLLPLSQRSLLLFFIGRLMWEPYVDDTIIIRTMLVWLAPIFGPILYLFCIALYAYPQVTDVHVMGAPIIALVVGLAILQIAAVIGFMYYGSLEYGQKQSKFYVACPILRSNSRPRDWTRIE